jgi:uncharacterized cofD-like protein
MTSGRIASVVSLGGGTGLSCLLKGLKHAVSTPSSPKSLNPGAWITRLTAVVTVTDDGGSSGRLRKELKVLPPGDIRNCLVALGTDESLLSHLFQYRFKGSGDLGGHSFGNLFLTALTGVTGDFLKAIRVSSDVLSIRGKIYPATLQDVRLVAHMEDGSRVLGESAIALSKKRIQRIALSPCACRPVRAVLEAIRCADIITVGPGSLYTSILPNLLVRGIAKAIRDARGFKVYISNLMTQPGETTGLTTSDHIQAIADHAGAQIFDGIILNRQRISPAVLSRYEREGAYPVINDFDRIRKLGLKIFEGRFLAESRVVRHDPDRLALGVYKAYVSEKSKRRRRDEEALTATL